MPRPHPSLSRVRGIWSSQSPLLLFAIKSALAAGLSWEITSSLLGDEAAALAVVSAVIVVQVTSWQTARKGLERIVGVIIGVSLAVLVAHFLGLHFWTITLTIFVAQIIGMFLQNRGQYLATQIPISAALALVLGATAGTYPLLRLQGALVGGIVGTVMSLFLSPPVYVFRARDAVADVTDKLASAIPKLADALAGRLSEAGNREIYSHMRKLEQRVRATEQAYSLGVDSMRLNPWALAARHLLVDYPDVLLALDRLTRQMRRIAYTINEPSLSWTEIARTQDWPRNYAWLLEEVGSILLSTSGYIRSPATTPGTDLPTRQSLSTRLEHAQQQLHVWQVQLTQDAKQTESLRENTTSQPLSAGYHIAVRGAILTDLRRMLDEARDVVEMTSHP